MVPESSPVPPSGWRDLPVGARVVVRRRLDPAEAARTGHVWTDVIGIVLAVDDAGLRLRPDAPRSAPAPGEAAEVVVPGAAIEAMKRLGPRPAPRSRPARG
ncbi:hypothetical protein GCM10009809_05850 [Isoptericola hypogeus]|uniref:Uncharacterized protein n=1 Tax=Isoptericola hypogeus TaxID=300179 RepID=A0ABP4UUY8_9MICO